MVNPVWVHYLCFPMSQLSRLISILTLLKSKRILTATELSEKFDVSVRTIYRDVKKLEDSGVPILTIEGKGYSIMDGYTVEPVQFTEKEANALITAELLINQSSDESFKADFKDALTKIKSVFKSSVQEKSELLQSKIHAYEEWSEYISSNILSEIQMAITNFNLVEIHYKKVTDKEALVRMIEPIAIFTNQNRWMVIAWCHLREDYRAFRIDRIKNFRIHSDKFEERGFDLKAFFEKEDNYGK